MSLQRQKDKGKNIMSKNVIDRIGAEKIIEVCKSAKSFKEACEQLNCGYRYLISAAIKLGCYDELNARSKKFAKKRDFKNSLWRVKDTTSRNKNGYITDHKIWCQELFAGRILTASEKIKRHLYAAGFKENKCECCGITEWNGKPISCQLHHIDGNPQNNKLENLQILCPNCHTQTDNYGSKNAKNKERGMTSSSEDSGL